MAKPQAEARRFLFEQSFDVARRSAKKPKPEDEKPPEPTFNAQQLEEARLQGYREGRLAGNEEATSSSEAEIARLVTDIAGRLPALCAAQAEANDRLQRDGATLMAAIARKILPAMVERNGLDEIEALLATCLRTLIDQPKIVVRVGARHSENIATHLADAAAASGFDGRFMVEADDTMGPSDCRISWQSGGLERRAEAIWQQVDAAVGRYLGTPADEHDAPLPQSGPPEGHALKSDTDTATAGADQAADSGSQAPAPAAAETTETPDKALDA